jgi:hypothetical protein
MVAQREGGCIVAQLFNLGAKWGAWSRPCPGSFIPGKETQYQLYRRLRVPQSQSGRVRKISSTPGFEPRIVHSVASHYTDYAIRAANL